MAASSSWTHEIESPVTASRLFRAAILDWHTLAPKLIPAIVESAHIDGDGNANSVRQLNFKPGMPFTYVKERLDSLDKDNLEVKSTLIEGGEIGKSLETATMDIKVEPTANGGSIVKVHATYKLLPGVEVKDENEITKIKESVTGTFKVTEAYLVANPDAYN